MPWFCFPSLAHFSPSPSLCCCCKLNCATKLLVHTRLGWLHHRPTETRSVVALISAKPVGALEPFGSWLEFDPLTGGLQPWFFETAGTAPSQGRVIVAKVVTCWQLHGLESEWANTAQEQLLLTHAVCTYSREPHCTRHHVVCCSVTGLSPALTFNTGGRWWRQSPPEGA